MSKRKIKEFNGGYSCIGKIWVEIHKCTLCGIEKMCIGSDASEGEYSCSWICSDCVKIECDRGTSSLSKS